MGGIQISSAPQQYQAALRKADANDKPTGFNDKIDTPEEAKAALDIIKPGNKVATAQAEASLRQILKISDKNTETAKGEDIIGNPKFGLVTGKMYPFEGATVQIKDARMKISFDSLKDSGAVHDYDGGAWNGNPLDIAKYSKLHIVVSNGSNIEAAKVEINGIAVIPTGTLKEGVNTIDLTKYKKDDFDPWKDISKINFVNSPGKGSYIVELKLE